MNFITGETLTPGDEARYINLYIPLVDEEVRQLACRSHAVVDEEDMQQIALAELLLMLRRYGPPDAQFAELATQRIRYAILDELRRLDWRSRRLQQQARRLKGAIRKVTRRLGHSPMFSDLQRYIPITLSEYVDYQQLECAKSLESLETLLEQEVYVAALDSPPLEEQVTGQMQNSVLAVLNSRERFITTLYYQYEISLKDIADQLNLTEARVCQLKRKIVEKIQKLL